MSFGRLFEGNLAYRSTLEDRCAAAMPAQEVIRALFASLLSHVFRRTAFFLAKKDLKEVRLCLLTFRYQHRDRPPDSKLCSYINLKKVNNVLLILRLLLEDGLRPVVKREVFYHLVTRFRSQAELDALVAELCFVGRVPRRLLNILPAAKGLVFGNLWIRGPKAWAFAGDASRYSRGKAIDMDEDAEFMSQARWVLVVEKETVFFDLMTQDFALAFPDAILVTGRGYGDYLTKRFLLRLFMQLPRLLFFYLGDADPFGIDIFLNYLLGAPISMHEEQQLPFLHPLGLSMGDCGLLDARAGKVLTGEDIQKLSSIISLEVFDVLQQPPLPTRWGRVMQEKLQGVLLDAQLMKAQGRKYEIEALSPPASLPRFIGQKLRSLCFN